MTSHNTQHKSPARWVCRSLQWCGVNRVASCAVWRRAEFSVILLYTLRRVSCRLRSTSKTITFHAKSAWREQGHFIASRRALGVSTQERKMRQQKEESCGNRVKKKVFRARSFLFVNIFKGCSDRWMAHDAIQGDVTFCPWSSMTQFCFGPCFKGAL